MKTLLSLLMLLVLLTTGCQSLLPTERVSPDNKWRSYEEALASFEQVIPHVTTVSNLSVMGFDPLHSPNIKVLTYLDVLQRFFPSQSITKEDLPSDILECLKAKDCCKGYELIIESTNKKRFGSLPMDAMGFKKNTHITGWSFRALFVIQDGVVTYKLSSGEPKVDKKEKKGQPLGPFQSLENFLGKLPNMFL